MKSDFDARKDLTLVAYKTFSDVAGKSASFIVAVIAARVLTPREFGVFALGATVGWLMTLASDFGMQVHVARAVARRPSAAPAILGRWLPVRFVTAGVALAALALLASVSGFAAGYRTALVLFTAAYLASGLLEFLYFYVRGLGRSDLESTMGLAHRGLMLVAAVGALWWRADVRWLAVALLGPAVLALGIMYYAVRRLDLSAAAPPSAADYRGSAFRTELLRDVLPIGTASLLAALYFRVDILLIEAWKGTEAVGLYNAVFRIVEAMRLFPAAVIAVALPALFSATGVRPVTQVSAALTGFALVATATLWAAAGWLVPALFGSAYGGAVPVFRVLLLAFPLMSLNYSLTHQLIGWDGHRAYALLCAGALLLNVTLNVRWIPAYSIAGAAWATVATEVFLTLGCLALLWMPLPARQVEPS